MTVLLAETERDLQMAANEIKKKGLNITVRMQNIGLSVKQTSQPAITK